MRTRWDWAVVAAATVIVALRANAAPPLEAYGRLPTVEEMRLSPDGDRFAFVAVSGEARKLYVADFTGKALLQAPVGQAKVRAIRFVGEDHVLVTTSATVDLSMDFGYKYELFTVYNVDLATAKATTVFQGEHAIAQTVVGSYGEVLAQGKPVGYFGGITFARTTADDYVFQHGWADLYRVDLQTGRSAMAAHGEEDIDGWAVAPNGSVIAHATYDQKSGRWRLLSGAFLGKVLVDRSSPQNDIGLRGLGRTPDTVLVTDNTGDRSTAEEVSVKDGSVKELFEDEGVDGYLRDPSTGLLIGAITTGEPGAVFFDPKLQARYKGTRKAFPNLKVHLASYSHDLQRLIVETEGSGDSGTYWIVDIASGKADPIGSVHPDIKPADVGPVTVFPFKAADGLEMNGVLTLPPGKPAKDLPLVVMPHGGPIDIRDEPGFDDWAQAFASRGYAVFQPNYRGSGGRSVAFRQAGFGEWGGKMLSDIADGVQALAAKGIVDPKRACIVGASYGGYAALAGVTLQHGLYRCAVSVAGPANMSSFFSWQVERHGDQTGTTRYWRAAIGMDKSGDRILKAISPTSFADKTDGPVLLIHGRDDTVVPVEQSRQMASALRRAGKPVELIEIPGGDHWELHEDARLATVANSVSFVLKHNPPG